MKETSLTSRLNEYDNAAKHTETTGEYSECGWFLVRILAVVFMSFRGIFYHEYSPSTLLMSIFTREVIVSTFHLIYNLLLVCVNNRRRI